MYDRLVADVRRKKNKKECTNASLCVCDRYCNQERWVTVRGVLFFAQVLLQDKHDILGAAHERPTR